MVARYLAIAQGGMHGLRLEREIDVGLWSEVKTRQPWSARSCARFILESLNWYITLMDTTSKDTTISGRKKRRQKD